MTWAMCLACGSGPRNQTRPDQTRSGEDRRGNCQLFVFVKGSDFTAARKSTFPDSRRLINVTWVPIPLPFALSLSSSVSISLFKRRTSWVGLRAKRMSWLWFSVIPLRSLGDPIRNTHTFFRGMRWGEVRSRGRPQDQRIQSICIADDGRQRVVVLDLQILRSQDLQIAIPIAYVNVVCPTNFSSRHNAKCKLIDTFWSPSIRG